MDLATAAAIRIMHRNWSRLKEMETEITNIMGEVNQGREIELDIRAGGYMIHGVKHPQAENVLNTRLTAIQNQIAAIEAEIAAM